MTEVGLVEFFVKEETEVDAKSEKETDLLEKPKKEAKPVNVPKDVKQPKQQTKVSNPATQRSTNSRKMG